MTTARATVSMAPRLRGDDEGLLRNEANSSAELFLPKEQKRAERLVPATQRPDVIAVQASEGRDELDGVVILLGEPQRLAGGLRKLEILYDAFLQKALADRPNPEVMELRRRRLPRGGQCRLAAAGLCGERAGERLEALRRPSCTDRPARR